MSELLQICGNRNIINSVIVTIMCKFYTKTNKGMSSMGKLYSILRQREAPPDTPAPESAEKANEMCDPRKMMAGEVPALSMPAASSLNFGAATVSPAQFAKLAGVGHNLVRAWCHLPGFPVHREGWRFHINVEMGLAWLQDRAAAREGMDDLPLGRVR